MQLRRGVVTVTTGSPTVRGVYVAVVTGVSGTFVPTEVVSWTGGGLGVVTHHDTIASKLYFTRTSGPVPVATNIVVNAGPTKLATIASFASDSTPRFVTELAGPGGPKLFTVQESGIVYSLSGAADEDSFALAGNYAGVTNLEAAYVVIRDFTPFFGWAIPGPGDIDLPSILARTFLQIEQAVAGGLKSSVTFALNWADAPGLDTEYWLNGDRTVSLSGAGRNVLDAPPSTMFTLPVGYRPLYVRRFASGSGHQIEINTAGDVRVLTGVLSGAVYVDGINFRAEA